MILFYLGTIYLYDHILYYHNLGDFLIIFLGYSYVQQYNQKDCYGILWRWSSI